MRKAFPLAIRLVLIILTLAGCSDSQFDELPGIKIDSNKVNSDFIIYEDSVGGSTNTHRNGEYLAVTGKNKGPSNILLAPDYVKLFAKTEKGWIQIDNQISYPNVETVLPPAKDFAPGIVKVVIPSIPNMTTPTLIRIFLEGRLEDTNEPIGAYLDVTLQP